MSRLIRYLRGSVRFRLTGAAPEQCLNALAAARLEFWDIEREDALNLSLCVPAREAERLQRLALRCLCTAEVTERSGLRAQFGGLLRRPVLLLGLLAASAATFVLQEFVWTIEVEGNDRLPAGQIVQALEELGIAPGTWGPSIDSPETRNRMLLRMPELAWLAVNRSGGRVQVLVTERQQPPDTRAPYAVANVVAARDGVLTEVSVTEGMRLCAVGDTVRQGQLLVSGYEDYGLFIRPVCASAEIYARTWHTGTVVTPAERLEKRYTGREWKQVTLIVGKNRIKLWGNSSISQQDCDKMIVEKAVRTSGYAYPLRLETAILREYVLEPAPAPQVQTEKLLQEAWRRAVQAQMLAGRIDATQESLLMQGGLCILQAQSDCTELISRTLPLEAAD